MAEDIWFPFYVGDYLADTMHLDARGHGLYLLVLLAYYKNKGPLLDDDQTLANITKLSLSDWRATRSIIAQFFKIQNGRWIHKRADQEISKRISSQVARSKGAALTNAKRWGSLSDSPSDSVSDPGASRSSVGIPQSQSQSYKKGDVQSFGNPTANGSHKPARGKISPSVLMISQQTELKRVEAAIQSIKAKHGTPLPLSVKPELDRLKSRRSELINSLKFAV